MTLLLLGDEDDMYTRNPTIFLLLEGIGFYFQEFVYLVFSFDNFWVDLDGVYWIDVWGG